MRSSVMKAKTKYDLEIDEGLGYCMAELKWRFGGQKGNM